MVGTLSRCHSIIYCVLIVSSAIGCRGGLSPGVAVTSSSAVPEVQQHAATPTVSDDEEHPPIQTQEEALSEVLDELADIDAIDSDAKQVLMADLKEAKPENWPLIVQQFKSALAYRQQLAAREESEVKDSNLQESTTSLVAAKQPSPSTYATDQTSKDQETATTQVSFDTQSIVPPEPNKQVTTINRSETNATTRPHLEIAKEETTSPLHAAMQVNYLRADSMAHDWQAHLQNAIEDLNGKVQPTPGSTDEVNQHLRLRLLQLLAGNDESALAPIPGATATQQDYWNKQLFALSTFLDNSSQPDGKRRAASSLMHLDGARAKLAELATLQVQKLAFVDSVEGFGAYEPREETSFKPGDKVTLYCEIENFSSEATKEGYRTSLGTSYEVVDRNGKRVDSAQFPEIEDLCSNPRRDFHMQYTVTLPKHIYPEQYELRLTVTDQQSHKIGQASVPFEIVE